jgi:hypothetical protein
MRRTSAAALAGLTLLTLLAAPAGAAPPRMYHNVSVVSASFDSVQVDGCLQTELYAAATTGHWAGRHGPAVKQDGPTSVFVRVMDVCTDPGGDLVTAAAGPGGDVLLEVEATSMSIGLTTDQHLTSARAAGTLEGTDQDGTPVTVGLDVRWTAAGPLEHVTEGGSTRYPGEGIVAGAANEWLRPATATAVVTLDGDPLHGSDAESMIQRTKSHCLEVPTGSDPPEDFFPCFGFEG